MHTPRTDVTQLATIVISEQLDLFKYPISLQRDKIGDAFGAFLENKYYLISNDVIMIYSYKFRAWTIFKSEVVNMSSLSEMDDSLVFGGSDGLLYKIGDNYHDEGVPIVAYWASKRFDYGKASIYKKFKEMFIVAHVYEGYRTDLSVRYEIDYIDITQIASIVNKISYWGSTTWGDRFINRDISPSLPVNIGQRGRVIRYVYANGKKIDATYNTEAEMRNSTGFYKDKFVRVLADNSYWKYTFEDWVKIEHEDVFQPMKVYEINGTYQIGGTR
jgi:hypothetical protein